MAGSGVLLSPHATSPLLWALDAVRLSGQRFAPYAYQAAILHDRSPRQLVLKSRQVGITTAVAIREAHAALFRPGHLSLIVSKDRESASEVVETINALYHELERPPRRERESARELRLENGSRIVAPARNGEGGTGAARALRRPR